VGKTQTPVGSRKIAVDSDNRVGWVEFQQFFYPLKLEIFGLHRRSYQYNNVLMALKSKSRNIITLKKSSTGTLEAPKFTRYRFNSWQRLWIVTGIIYLLMLAGSFYVVMPDKESIERQMVFSVTEEVRHYDGMAFAGESPQKIFEIANSQGYAQWIESIRFKYHIRPDGNAGFDKIENEYREAISDLPVKRTIGVIICVVAWLLPMAVLYAIGFVVDWIKRGAGVIPE